MRLHKVTRKVTREGITYTSRLSPWRELLVLAAMAVIFGGSYLLAQLITYGTVHW
jgi:hypothetical protein